MLKIPTIQDIANKNITIKDAANNSIGKLRGIYLISNPESLYAITVWIRYINKIPLLQELMIPYFLIMNIRANQFEIRNKRLKNAISDKTTLSLGWNIDGPTLSKLIFGNTSFFNEKMTKVIIPKINSIFLKLELLLY